MRSLIQSAVNHISQDGNFVIIFLLSVIFIAWNVEIYH